jgi:hypothetical protein
MNTNLPIIELKDFSLQNYLNNTYHIRQVININSNVPKQPLLNRLLPIVSLSFGFGKEKEPQEEKDKAINKLKIDLIKAHQEFPLSKDEIETIVHFNFELTQHLIEQKILSPNFYYNKTPLLHYYKSKNQLKKLVNLGADINIKSKEEKTKDLTLFKIALKNQNTGLLKILDNFKNNAFLNKAIADESQKKLSLFLLEKKDKEQFKKIHSAIKENNHLILNELKINLNKYKNALMYETGYQKNLLHYAIEFKQLEYVKFFIENNIFSPIHQKCYTQYALDKNASHIAFYCIDNNFFNQSSLLDRISFPGKEKVYYEIFKKLVDKKISVPLKIYIKRGYYQELEQNYEQISEIKNLTGEEEFWQKSAISDFKHPVFHYYLFVSKQGWTQPIYKQELRAVFSLLKIMENTNHPIFSQSFNIFVNNINQAQSENLMIDVTNMGIQAFPEKERLFIDNLKNDNAKSYFEKIWMEKHMNLETIDKKHKIKI